MSETDPNLLFISCLIEFFRVLDDSQHQDWLCSTSTVDDLFLGLGIKAVRRLGVFCL